MSEFHQLLLGLHAQARRIDRDQALLGALGVAAIPYPHQLDSVHRMVTATSCRWLLADEVGLGKTIQAIMVMRALAAQSPRALSVALVVPDELSGQWTEELLCRGHILPIEVGQEGNAVGNIVLRLARPSQLASDKRLAAEKIDLLIIDEFTRLQVQVRRNLITAARNIPNVIVLTATPALHLAPTRRELMALLEPEADRIAQAEDRDILKVLADREVLAMERCGKEMADAAKRRAVEEAFGLYRHLIRAVRTDYPDVLPRRIYQPIRVAPTDGDIERAKATRSYLESARTSNLDIRRDLLLQVAGRSPVSLRERLSTLRRPSPDLQTAWKQIDNCLREEPGDAKLDALIDHLRKAHARKPNARIVVVAEDNPTTDYLRDTIEKLADVRVAKKRRSTTAAEELADQVAILKEALDDFISGEAKVLVAADAAREGYNLQFADEIIFFALPWSPHDIQQWIGRIDRLGAKDVRANRRIEITPIIVVGSIEDQILEVLEATGVFLKSEVFDESEWEAISKAIGAAVEGSGNGNWADAVREAKNLGSSFDAWLQATHLPPSPRTAIATRCEAEFRNRSYAAPMAEIDGYPWNWYLMRERAAGSMINIAREDYLEVRDGQMGVQRFRTMWYKSRPGPGDFTIPDLDTRSSWYHQAYIARRSFIECPPRTHVVQNDEEKRRLHFFDHGSTLHDGAVDAFQRQAPSSDILTEFVVEYPVGHPALRWAGRRLLFATAEIDLLSSISFDSEAILGDGDPRPSKPEQDARSSAARVALAQFQADRRWLIDLAPPRLLVTVHIENGDNLVAEDTAAAALLDPIYGGICARQIGRRRLNLSGDQVTAARSAVKNRLSMLAQDYLSRAAGLVRSALETRLLVARADADGLVDAARAEVAVAQKLDSKHEFNKAAQRGAALGLALAEDLWTERAARLNGLEEAMPAATQITKSRRFWIAPRAPTENPL